MECGVIHPPEFSNVRDPHGCLLVMGHPGPHEFVCSGGIVYQWEEEACPACDCDLEAGECCTTYWRKPETQAAGEKGGCPMTERPIIFSAPMVRAILDGTKTQTRRVLKTEPVYDGSFAGGWKLKGKKWRESALCSPMIGDLCPHGKAGDRLWVRETWFPDPPCDGTWGYTAWAGCREGQIAAVPDQFRRPVHCCYRADWTKEGAGEVRWTPAIHMPRWASRITLEITSVRVERLQSISADDSRAEGAAGHPDGPWHAYRSLWTLINGPESWDANPWVWVVEFRRITP